ncbi:hypothetical protein HAX54_050432 [Datura stramonium]|uniref:Uncharacterized protein n=1 Tax=Datura stramonium TaxID=4076 RepID=A0ABS8SWF2_DATST|nr:hypothetical protein [Datura stramonium]
MDTVLEESRQNTLKRRKLTRAMVLAEEAPSSQVVVLDTENPPHAVEKSPETAWESHWSRKARAKGKKQATPKEPSEEPGATVKKPKEKYITKESSKRKRDKEAKMDLLKEEGSGEEPGAILELQNENVVLKGENTALKKQLEDLTQQMLLNQHVANERIDKLLFKL